MFLYVSVPVYQSNVIPDADVCELGSEVASNITHIVEWRRSTLERGHCIQCQLHYATPRQEMMTIFMTPSLRVDGPTQEDIRTHTGPHFRHRMDTGDKFVSADNLITVMVSLTICAYLSTRGRPPL